MVTYIGVTRSFVSTISRPSELAEVLWNGGGCFWLVNQTGIFFGVVTQEPPVVMVSLEFQSTCLALSATIRMGSSP